MSLYLLQNVFTCTLRREMTSHCQLDLTLSTLIGGELLPSAYGDTPWLVHGPIEPHRLCYFDSVSPFSCLTQTLQNGTSEYLSMKEKKDNNKGCIDCLR